MKNGSNTLKLFILFGSFTLLFFSACSEEGSSTEGIQDFTLQVVNQNLEDSSATFSWKDSTYDISITKGDTQILEIPANEKNIGILNVAENRIQLFVGPGGDLMVSLSIKDDELDAAYGGSLADVKEASLSIQKEVLGQYPYNNPYAFYGMELDSFQLYIGKAMSSMDSLLGDLLDSQPNWADLVKSHMGYRINDYAVNYPLYHPSVAELDSFKVAPSYWSNLAEQFSVYDDDLLQLESKQSLTYTFVRNLNQYHTDSFIEDDSARIAELFHWADSIYDSQALQKTFKAFFLEEQITYTGIGNVGDWLEQQVNEYIKDENLKSNLLDKIEDWRAISKGSVAPQFKGQTVDSNMISLSDLRGKVVYVDVWATWCGPCRKEIPYLDKMYDKYAEQKDLALVSVSIDRDYDAWFKMVTEDEMGGIQIWTEDAWDSELNKSYMIQGIPRFILIDKKGKIITADAPRPSSEEEIYAMIEEAL